MKIRYAIVLAIGVVVLYYIYDFSLEASMVIMLLAAITGLLLRIANWLSEE